MSVPPMADATTSASANVNRLWWLKIEDREWKESLTSWAHTLYYHKTFQINNTHLFTHNDYAMSGRSRVRIPAGVRGFLQNVQNVSGAHPTPYSVGTGALS